MEIDKNVTRIDPLEFLQDRGIDLVKDANYAIPYIPAPDTCIVYNHGTVALKELGNLSMRQNLLLLVKQWQHFFTGWKINRLAVIQS